MLPEGASNDEVLTQLMAAIDRSQANIVVPTDDASIVALHAAAALSKRPGVSEPVRLAIANSLGDLRQLATLRERKRLADLARRLSVRAPAHTAVYAEADAIAFAEANGYPVVLKEEESVAGFGVFICKDAQELRAALQRSALNPGVFKQGLLAQTFVEGRTAMRVVVAREGRVLGGLSAIKLETWPSAIGPSTCVELIEHAEMKATVESVIGALGYSGFASFDFMLDGSDAAHLIELNPRPTPITHLGERFGSCLCRHWFAALTGTEAGPQQPQGLPSRVALFPQEWVRDQNSPYIREGVYHDAPWDEPDLLEAYVAFGRGQMRYAGYRALAQRSDDLRARLAELENSG